MKDAHLSSLQAVKAQGAAGDVVVESSSQVKTDALSGEALGKTSGNAFTGDAASGRGGARTGDAATRACARQAGFDGRLRRDRGWHPEQLDVQDATRNSI